MKQTKRILAILTCVLLLMGSISVTAFAAGENGNCSITIKDPTTSEATVAGKTFNVYKIFNATTSGVNTAYSWNGDDYQSFFFGTDGVVKDKEGNPVQDGTIQDAVNYIASLKNAIDISNFAEALHKHIVKNGISETKTVTAGNEATSVTVGGLDYGYYMVYDATEIGSDTSAVRSAVMLDNVTSNVEIELKANRPSLQKTVLSNENTWLKGTSANVGDKITFKLTTVIPDHSLYTNYKYYIVDTLPAGLKLDENTFKNNVKLYVNSETATTAITDDNLNITFPTGEAEGDFKIEFLGLTGTDPEFEIGDTVSITYEVEFDPTGVVGNTFTNTAKLYYSNDPANDTSTGSVTNSANVYTFKLTLSKFAETTDGTITVNPLTGAEFKLKNADNETIYVKPFTFNEGEASEYTIYMVVDKNATDAIYTLKTHNKDFVEGSAVNTGEIVIFGLAEGTYYIEETKAPDGYIQPDAEFKLVIDDTVGPAGFISALSATGEHTGNYGSIQNVNANYRDLSVEAEITNRPGSALPSTGGMGTTLFTILGVILMAGAVAYLVVRRKKATA